MAPCTTAECPMVTLSPTRQGMPSSQWRTALSCTLLSAPISIRSSSARITAPNKTNTRSARSTWPWMWAPGAMTAPGSFEGGGECLPVHLEPGGEVGQDREVGDVLPVGIERLLNCGEVAQGVRGAQLTETSHRDGGRLSVVDPSVSPVEEGSVEGLSGVILDF